MSAVPSGWAKAMVDDTGEYINGMAFKATDWEVQGRPIIRIQNLTNPEKVLNRTTQAVEPRYLVERGDILVSWSATLDAFIWNREQSVLNQHIFKVVPNRSVVDSRFLFHGLRTVIREMIAGEHLHGSTMKHINRGPFLAHPFPLPPISEQRRIVAKIDSLTAKSGRARDHLNHIPRLVEKYKQAILAAAFRGDLTREWRENHCPATLSATTVSHERRRLLETHEQRWKQCENIGVVETDRPFELPEGWDWFRAEAICGFITKGTTPGSDLMSSSDGEVPFIKVYNLTFDGTLDFTVDPTFVSNTTHKGFLGRSKVLPGDVLMNIVGPPLGKVSVVPSQYAEWNINQAIAVFRPIPSVLPAFLSRWLLTDVLTRWAVSRSKATAGQSNLTLEICRNLPVPLCSYAEQVEIVRKIDAAMSWVNRLAGDANSARKLIDHLDQSVLAKAFKGELVPQDATDEPASAVLERIRAERVAGPKAKRGRTKAS